MPELGLDTTARATLAAAADRILPGDAGLPAPSELGTVAYVVRQVAGDWGRGVRLYRRPPFAVAPHAGHGWQYDLAPGEALVLGLSALDGEARHRHAVGYADLPPAIQDELLAACEADELPAIRPLRSSEFFELLLGIVIEGVFADPRYGGNRDRAAWRWIGFPGPSPSTRDLTVDPQGTR